MAGAAVLAALGALRSGAGYLHVACAAKLVPALTQAIPTAILHAFGDASRKTLSMDDVPAMLDLANACQSVVIGPGLGNPAHVAPWIPELLHQLRQGLPKLPIVLDADGLNHFVAGGVDWRLCTASMILTPHAGEAARLLGLENAEAIQADRVGAIQNLTSRCPAAFVLKGANTLIGQEGRETAVNSSGNVGMATAGSGDVLSGHLGALLAAGLAPFDAAQLGVYLHGRAGDRFAQEWGTDGLTASDLAQWISKAMQEWRTQAS